MPRGTHYGTCLVLLTSIGLCALSTGIQKVERDAAVVAHAGLEGDPQQAAELRQQLELYKEEREQLSKDVCFYKQSCKDLKQRLRTEVRGC